jgi:ATP-dependent exoDNAse (exonuclease V) beta subunit
MTRAVDRLIVSGAVDRSRAADAATPIGWVLGRLGLDEELEAARAAPVEVERGAARFLLRVERFRAAAPEAPEALPAEGQLALFGELPAAPPRVSVPALPPLEPPPAPPLHRVRRLSFTSLAQFESCSYKYFAIRVAGMRELPPEGRGEGGLAATEVGDAVHRLLEDATHDVDEVRAWYPRATGEELERIHSFVGNWHGSELARRLASLEGASREQHFTFEHDGVLLHGYLDVFHLADGKALVVDYKTNSLAEATPEEIVEVDYRLQRLVYALACFRAGAAEVEVVYSFLERPDAIVATRFERAQIPELEAELSEAIARIHAGDFRPTPSEWNCSGCPALDVVCAGPRLRGGAPQRPLATVG